MPALVVEDGTGLANADAFFDEDYMDAYATAHDLSGWLDGVGDGAAAIRRATLYVCNTWVFKGTRVNGRNQALAWPRVDVVDDEDQDVASDSVPIEVLQATAELAAYERANPGSLSPAMTLGGQIASERVGPIEVTYEGPINTPENVRPILLLVNDLLSGLIAGGGGGMNLTGIATRV